MIRILPLTAAFVIAFAAPASAQQRDPFVPLVSADTSVTTTTEGEQAPEAPPVPAPDGERLAATGTPVSQLVGLGLALIGVGAATTLIAATIRPRRIPHRAGSLA